MVVLLTSSTLAALGEFLNRRSFLGMAIAFFASAAILFAGGIWAFLKQAKFGSLPANARLQRIERSPNFRNGQFQNQIPTPMMTGDSNSLKTVAKFVFNRNKRLKPTGPIPSVRRDLRSLAPTENVLVWFGHSSYFLQIDGKRILVDPVLSGRASPVSFTTKAFDGTDPYTAADIPDIDVLFITHDHWDHLDYDTVTKLRPRVKRVICGLGVGAHFEKWGYASSAIDEGDWGDDFILGDGFTAHVLPARHFSGRALRRNSTLWASASYALQTPSGSKIYLGGDGGYGPHFKNIGTRFGGFDLAILENGQYDTAWRYIHMLPDETLQAAHDLQASLLFPVHNSKFCIANHDWDAPLRTITSLAAAMRPQLITPVIGAVVQIRNPSADSSDWWTKVS
jgi:L-ascorbate metabolism protein UlaG (beta-lactamase superfamily)